MHLPLSFYQRDNVVEIAQDLIGTYLFTKIPGAPLTGGMIIETEAYGGAEDKACHAYGGRRTKRTEVMYSAGGVAYVYLCYGMHVLFNVVTNQKETPHAVLIRALKPCVGLEAMQARRLHKLPLAEGPGTLCQALGIKLEHTGLALDSPSLWIEPRKEPLENSLIKQTPRIGVDYAGEHALLPWRFRYS